MHLVGLIARLTGIKSIYQYPLFRSKDNIVHSAKIFTENITNQIVSTEPSLIIKKKDNQYDDDIKDSVLIILSNCDNSISSLKSELKKVIKVIRDLEPKYSYLLTDLSTKTKKMYMF